MGNETSQIDAATRQVIINAYAHFCATLKTRPDALVAKRFAVEVTGSDAHHYHGFTSTQLERLLAECLDSHS
ncbi:MAG: hypothetical protein WBV39_03520 [Rudaea sp.]